MKKRLFIGVILLVILVLPATATTISCPVPTVTVNNNIAISNILTQIQWMTQQQSQVQRQEQQQEVTVASGTQNSWIISDRTEMQENIGSIVQNSQTYSRLLYPGEVLAFPAAEGSVCTVLAGLPIAFYTIDNGHGDNYDKVQTMEATPTYDPIRHRMEFGYVPVIDKIDYWTMKARLEASNDTAFCVVDNRAPMNGYTTIEVTVQS